MCKFAVILNFISDPIGAAKMKLVDKINYLFSLMNLHRKMSDRLVKLNNLYNDGKSVTRGISRARYNRYLDVKGRLQLLKQQFLDLRNVPEKRPIRVKLPDLVSTEEHAKPPPRPPPMPKRPLWKDDGKNRSG